MQVKNILKYLIYTSLIAAFLIACLFGYAFWQVLYHPYADEPPINMTVSNTHTVSHVDGRTFDFPIPDPLAANFYDSIHKEFLVGAINTPSPPKVIWKAMNKLMDRHRPYLFLKTWLEQRPKPTKADVEALIERTKKNLIFVKGGTFHMGDYGYLTPAKAPMTFSSRNDHPFKVTLSSYSLMKNQVTYRDYDIYTRTEGLPLIRMDGGYYLSVRYPDYPAFVTWYQAQDYCQWLGKITEQPFGLDTSAQYEYAARSGGKRLLLASKFQKLGDLIPDMGKFAKRMFKKSRKASSQPSVTVPINTYGSNYLGFMDMVGPVTEWVYDWYAPYPKTPQVNYRGPKTGKKKVMRTPMYGDRGTISRWNKTPNEPSSAFRCAVNSTAPWH